MAAAHARALLAIAFLFGSSAPSTASNPEMINFIHAGFGLSYAYDLCGDKQLGAQWRMALSSLVRSCPFSAADKDEIFKDAATEQKKFQEAVKHMRIPPEHVLDDKITCQGLLDRSHKELDSRLDDFVRGKITAAQALETNCNGGRPHK